MSRPDAAASAALDADFIDPIFFIYLDVDGDQFRANTSGQTITLTGTGFPEMDDEAFDGVTARFVDVSHINMSAGGTDQVTVRLSGLRDLDNATLNTMGDRTNWQGREAMLWRMIRDENGTQCGAIQHYYTGYMVSLDIGAEPDGQTIELTVEGYLAAFSQASNRSYLDQEDFDPGDLSARAAIAIVNGTPSSGATPLSPFMKLAYGIAKNLASRGQGLP